jgi:hypothetical protein
VPAGTYGSGSASCNAGEVLVGGGFTGASGPSGVENYNFTANGASQWGGYAFNHGGVPSTITFYAECLTYTGAHSSQTPYAQSSVAAGGIDTTTSHSCASGSCVSGGGFADDEYATVYTMFASGRSWQVYLQSAPGHTKLLNAYAECVTFS